MSEKVVSERQYISCSRYQYALLRKLRKKIIPDDEILFVDQRPMNGLCQRKYVVRITGGYALSELGDKFLDEFNHTDIMKANPSRNLGKYVGILRAALRRSA